MESQQRVVLARAETDAGEVALARRGDVVELIVDGVFAMDSREVASELALADELGPQPGRVLVGGLGLGYTADRLLANGAAEVVVVELAAPLLAWARDGVTPELGRVAADPRVTLVEGDVAAALTGGLPAARGPFDAVLLDVDNGPTFLVHVGNAGLYETPLLAAALALLRPGGQLGIWCESPSPELAATLGALAPTREVRVDIEREGRDFTYAIYLARAERAAGTA